MIRAKQQEKSIDRNTSLHQPQHTKEKQIRVESDVRCAAVCGHTVWLGHNDGSITVRKTRTAEVTRHFAASCGARVWSMISVNTYKGWFMWLGLSNGDIEVHAVALSDTITKEGGISTGVGSYKPTTGHSQYMMSQSSVLHRLQRHTGGVYCLTEFNGQVFSGSNDFEIMQWDASEMKFMRQLTGHSNYVRALHAEGSLLISASDDHSIRIWNALNGQMLSIARFHNTGVSTLCRVGVHMWSGDDSGKIIVWKLQTCEVEDTLMEHVGRVNVIKKIGSRVYTGSADHDILVWDAFSRQLVTRIADHRGWILGLSCPAQLCRYYVWSAAADGTVRCWHHDEYRAMTNDLERFDDVRWYHAEYTPFKEMNSALINQLQNFENKFTFLQRESSSTAASWNVTHSELQTEQEKARQLQLDNDRIKAEFDSQQKMLEQRHSQNNAKEKEMEELSEQLKKMTSSNVDYRCENEKLKTELEEVKRRFALATSEKEKFQKSLDEVLAARMIEGGPQPIIVTTETEAQEALKRLSSDLNAAVAMNESLRDDIQRLKSVVGGSGWVPPKNKGGGGGSTAQILAAASSAVNANLEQHHHYPPGTTTQQDHLHGGNITASQPLFNVTHSSTTRVDPTAWAGGGTAAINMSNYTLDRYFGGNKGGGGKNPRLPYGSSTKRPSTGRRNF